MHKQLKTLALICTFALLCNVSFQWSGNGHMLVAQIAQLELQQRNPTLFSQLETIVEYINDQTDGHSQDFVQSATWPDDIRQTESKWNNWHFTNIVYDPSGYPNNQQPEINNNVTYAIPFIASQLKGNSLDKQTQSEYLRLLIHFVGDIHQPLHCTELISAQYPDGDQGGNKIKISGNGLPSYAELHGYWDRIAYDVKYWTRPLTAASYSELKSVAQELMTSYTRDSLAERLTQPDVNVWASESFQAAEKNAYEPLPTDNVITDAYKAQALPIMKEQIAIAGYRLTDLLLQVFSASQEIKEQEYKFLAQ